MMKLLIILMSDGVSLEARIMKPIGFPPPAGFDGVILIHGYGGSKGDMQLIAQAMAIYGYASIAYSVRGQGGSEGCSTVSGPREEQDLLEVVNYFRNYGQINPDRIGITGGSQGGIHSWMAAVDRMPFFLSSHSELMSSPDVPSWIDLPIVGPGLTTAVHDEATPREFALKQNYPNPFNPGTTISFRLPKASYVTLKIFDMLGREVSTVVSGILPAGDHSRRWEGADLGGGVYMYRLQAEGQSETRKLILMR